MTLSNPAAPGGSAIIYTGVTASLNVVLKNETGGAIILEGGTSPAVLEIFMPFYFAPAEVQAMQINSISQSGWAATYNSADISLQLTWQNDTGTWANGESLTFTISRVLSEASPQSDSVQINFNQLKGSSIPSQVSVTLILSAPPVQANANLGDVLDVETVYGGNVYVSSTYNPLSNTLYVNLKNTGLTPLYQGDTMWTGHPQVAVTFVYGTTSGALAPDDKSESTDLGSAWEISGSVYVDQTAGWNISNPSVTSGANSPSWTLAPNSSNQEIIGVGANANVTFAFSNIVSFTPVGNTQVYLNFSGFQKDANTAYNDEVFVVGIHKLVPPTAGAIGIWSQEDRIVVEDISADIAVALTWSMFGVGSVKLSFYLPGVRIPEQQFAYGSAHPTLNYDTQTIMVSGLKKSQLLTFYCEAYGSNDCTGPMLNKVSGSVPLIVPIRINSFTIEPATVAPPYSYAYLLQWDIQGEDYFQITAYSGTGSPQLLSVPQDAVSYLVNPTAPETIYTLNLYGDASLMQQQ